MDGKGQSGETARIALLSNVNMDFVARLLRKQTEVWRGEGYGNELGLLMNPASSYHAFGPDITFLLMDLMELLEHELEPEPAGRRLDEWFGNLEGALKEEKTYYISDAYLWGPELSVLADPGRKAGLEYLWQQRLEELCGRRKNVRIFPYRHLVESLGEEAAFSAKMWYMGKILLGNEAQKRLCGLILEKVRTEQRSPKKVLLLDLDNTLWGGLAGEQEHTPVELSEEHGGLAYKNLQRVILQMQKQGVLLGIVSKNNEADALEVLEHHPHMVLGPEVFAARRINWKPKHENIREIAGELNLGLDSFVFWDDSPQERQLVKEMLPQVEIPDFPERKEELAPAMAEIYRKYFSKPAVTEEDAARTAQYAANTARRELQDRTGSFEDYLRQLETRAARVDPRKHMERLVQLMNKTNQFNLTTRRYTRGQMAELLEDPGKRVYLYSVSDRYGDSGVSAAAIADCTGGIPVLTDFVMSCRIMGKNIEDALIEDIERDLRESGYKVLRGIYIPTAKNMPVSDLYERLGYWKAESPEAEGQSAGEAENPEAAGQSTGEAESPNAGVPGGPGQEAAPGPSESSMYEIRLDELPERLYYVKIEDASNRQETSAERAE